MKYRQHLAQHIARLAPALVIAAGLVLAPRAAEAIYMAKDAIVSNFGTIKAQELVQVTDSIASVTTSSVAATGSAAVQFVFKNAAGVHIASVRRLPMYIATSGGVPDTAASSFATLTNGTVDTSATGLTGKYTWANTTAAGLLGVTLAAGSPRTTYLSFVLPNQHVITSSVITIN